MRKKQDERNPIMQKTGLGREGENGEGGTFLFSGCIALRRLRGFEAERREVKGQK